MGVKSECDFLGSTRLTVGLSDLGGLFQEKWFHDSALQCVALDKSWSFKVCLQQAAASGDVMNYLRVRLHTEKNLFFATEQKGSPNVFPCLCPSPSAVGADTVHQLCNALITGVKQGEWLSAQFPLGFLYSHSISEFNFCIFLLCPSQRSRICILSLSLRNRIPGWDSVRKNSVLSPSRIQSTSFPAACYSEMAKNRCRSQTTPQCWSFFSCLSRGRGWGDIP